MLNYLCLREVDSFERCIMLIAGCVRGYRFIGVADIAAVRFSLPAHLLEPTPNLGMLGDGFAS